MSEGVADGIEVHGPLGALPYYLFKHERFCAAPADETTDLFAWLGLEFAPSLEKRLRELTNSSNPKLTARMDQISLDAAAQADLWKQRLPEKVVAKIRNDLKTVWPVFYHEDSWDGAGVAS